MIELLGLAAAASLAGWLVRRAQRRRSSAVAAGEPTRVPCMLKWTARSPRWRPGRLLVGAEQLAWKRSSARRP
ncbi:hypothetical protein [Streptomyces liangshanensis]|uniref:hypothetical protein n=1 Tax=Streptomyces liangshanensis TaxID=2717324 RepID=UPI0036DEEB87